MNPFSAVCMNVLFAVASVVAFLFDTGDSKALWPKALGTLFAIAGSVGTYLQYEASKPYKTRVTREQFKKKSDSDDWGVLILGSQHRKGERPEVSVSRRDADGTIEQLDHTTRYLGNGDLELTAWPQAIGSDGFLYVEIRG